MAKQQLFSMSSSSAVMQRDVIELCRKKQSGRRHAVVEKTPYNGVIVAIFWSLYPVLFLLYIYIYIYIYIYMFPIKRTYTHKK